MLKVKIENEKEHSVEFNDSKLLNGQIDGEAFEWDIIEVKNGSFHVLKNNKSYNVEIIKADYEEKSFVIGINGAKYHLSVKDKFDELLKNLGFDNGNASKVNEMKAPMPGMIIDIMVTEGSVVKKGDPVLVLEAMKMENILKSPVDAIIKKINVKKGNAVEKKQVLLSFA